MNYKKGFIVPLVIAIVGVLAIAGGVYLVSQNGEKKPVNNQAVSGTDKKTYQNDKFGFGFDYPSELTAVSLGPNEEQKKVARGEMISGTVPPVFDAITFSNFAKKEQFNVIVFDVTKNEVSNAGSSGTACDSRFQKSDSEIPTFVKTLVTKNGVPVLEESVVNTDPKQGNNRGCYFFKNNTGNLIVFNISGFAQKADFLKVFNLVGDTVLPTLRVGGTATWKTYTNTAYGFTLKYPTAYTFVDNGPDPYELQLRAGEQISGTQPPLLTSIDFLDLNKKIVLTVAVADDSMNSIVSINNKWNMRACGEEGFLAITPKGETSLGGYKTLHVVGVPDFTDPKLPTEIDYYCVNIPSTPLIISYPVYPETVKAEVEAIITSLQFTTPATVKIGKIPVDLADVKVLQKAVDEGHQPWRLDPSMVAQSVVPDGSSQPVEVLINSQTESLTSLIYFVVLNGKQYEVTVTQPVRGQNKIWVVTDIEYAPTTSAPNTTTQTKIYTDTKNGFSIAYPITLTLQTSNVTGDEIGNQEQSTSPSAEKLVQVSSGKGELLTIGVSPDPKDIAKCLIAPESHPGNGTGAIKTLKINGASFLTYTRGDVSLVDYSNNHVYRTIHNNACWTITEASNRTQENRLTPEEATAQKNDLEYSAALLDPVVQSFKFVGSDRDEAKTVIGPISPAGVVLPTTCKIIGKSQKKIASSDPLDYATYWTVDCGAKAGSDSRTILDPVFQQQGWSACDSGVASAQWWKDGLMTGVAVTEHSVPPYPFQLMQTPSGKCPYKRVR